MSSQESSPPCRSLPRTVGDQEEVSLLGANSTASVVTPSLDDVQSVWDFEKIEKLGAAGDELSKRWRCGWCSTTLRGWHATKAMNHLARLPGNNDVKACSGPIPKETLAFFRSFRLRKMEKKTVKKRKQEAYSGSVSDNQKSMAVAFEEARIRKSASSGAKGGAVDLSHDDDEDVAVTNSSKLTTAVAEFVFGKGLPFSACEGDQFQQVLKLARLVPSSYRPPTRKVLAGDLLEASYDNRICKYMADLNVDSEVYGLSLFGDGATVHGMPLMNILAAGVYEPCAVLSIIDCKFLCGVCICSFVGVSNLCCLFALFFLMRRYRSSC
jgi:hypothetical protein